MQYLVYSTVAYMTQNHRNILHQKQNWKHICIKFASSIHQVGCMNRPTDMLWLCRIANRGHNLDTLILHPLKTWVTKKLPEEVFPSVVSKQRIPKTECYKKGGHSRNRHGSTESYNYIFPRERTNPALCFISPHGATKEGRKCPTTGFHPGQHEFWV